MFDLELPALSLLLLLPVHLLLLRPVEEVFPLVQQRFPEQTLQRVVRLCLVLIVLKLGPARLV
jgi:hypothetical protein